MNIEISGVSAANRGALLMMEAVRHRLADVLPNSVFAVPLDWTVEDRLAHGVWSTPGQYRASIQARAFGSLPARMRRTAGFMRPGDIDALLDISGFGYGDFWGVEKLRRRLTDRLDRWKTVNNTAILMPQALGPFERPGMADAFRKAADRLDIIYVRDARSQDYLGDILKTADKVRRAPDFTNLLEPVLPERLQHLRGASFVIPNEKIVAGRPPEFHERYLAFLVHAVTELEASGRRTMLLLHEGVRDMRLARQVNDRLPVPLSIVDEPDPLVTKGMIGAADLVISSRFHGLVSALSAGVPALACGWSHKYAELLTDYDCADMIVDIGSGEDPSEMVGRFIASSAHADRRDHIAKHAEKEKARAERMWDEIMPLLAQ